MTTERRAPTTASRAPSTGRRNLPPTATPYVRARGARVPRYDVAFTLADIDQFSPVYFPGEETRPVLPRSPGD